MTGTTHAGIWLEHVGGTADFPHYENIERPKNLLDPCLENWWQGVFRLAFSERLTLSNGTDATDLRVYLHLISSLDADSITKYRVTTGFGNLHFLDNTDPPVADGALILAPNAFRSVVECIRSGQGKIRLLLWLIGLDSSFSGDETHWDVARTPRPVIENFEMKIRYGDVDVPQKRTHQS